MPGEFKHGLCDCFSSLPDCCLGYWCPCILGFMASNSAGEETIMSALQCLFYPLLIPLMRYQVRAKKNIDGSIVGDLAAGWCCSCCSTIQLKREFDN